MRSGVIMAALTLAVSGGTNASQPLTTAEHHQYWSALEQSYEITFQQACFCLPDYLRPIRILVRDGSIVKATFEDDNSKVPSLIVNDLQTVSEMFEAIITAESMPAESIQLEFDQQFHFPSKVKIDYDIRLADDEVFWQFSKLKLHRK